MFGHSLNIRHLRVLPPIERQSRQRRRAVCGQNRAIGIGYLNPHSHGFAEAQKSCWLQHHASHVLAMLNIHGANGGLKCIVLLLSGNRAMFRHHVKGKDQFIHPFRRGLVRNIEKTPFFLFLDAMTGRIRIFWRALFACLSELGHVFDAHDLFAPGSGDIRSTGNSGPCAWRHDGAPRA